MPASSSASAILLSASPDEVSGPDEISGPDESWQDGWGDDLVAQMETARRIIEEKFLAAGDILTQSIQGFETLISGLDRLGAALGADAVDATVSELRAAAEKLNALPEDHRARMARYEALRKSRDALALPLADMRTNLAYMRAFTVNIKIVSGGLGDIGDEFALFADDIAQCIEKGVGELKQLDADTAALQEKLETAQAQGTGLGKQIQTMLPMLPQELVHCADETRTHYRHVTATVSGVAELARDIRKKVAGILAALQIGDITRQRIEHVQTGVRTLGEIAAAQPVLRRPRIAALIHALLARLLASAGEDFQHDVAAIETGMAAMGSDARRILELHGAVYGDDAKGGFLHTLGRSIDQARELVDRIDTADRAAIATGRETAEAARGLNQSILDIQLLKNDVQYMALNTTIKCCQIGTIGQPLSVIALELRDHGGALEKAAEEGLAALDALIRLAAELEDGTREAETKSDSKAAAAALFETSGRIRQAAEQNDREISGIAEEGDRVLKTLELSKQRLRFRADIGDTLECTTRELTELGDSATACADDILEPVGAILGVLAASYTMAQERDVHQAFVESFAAAAPQDAPCNAAGTAVPPDAAAAAPQAADDYEDVLF